MKDMNQQTRWQLLRGQDSPPPESIELRAGPLTMKFINGDLRHIRLGDKEVLLRVYLAVRDQNWGTIPMHITHRDVSIQSDSFEIHYQAEHHQRGIHFVWDASIIGSADGSITFTADGFARSTFLRNRIGLCVLHPMSCAGSACIVEHADGTLTQSSFPDDISPSNPFRNMRAIIQEVDANTKAEIRFEGDIFETEDQRNWTDASYKTFSTPSDLPKPVEITAGTRVQQSVKVQLIGEVKPAAVSASESVIQFTIADQSTHPLPKIGLGTPASSQRMTDLDIQRLRLLNLSHLRVDVRFGQSDWDTRLRQRLTETQQLQVALELALYVTGNAYTELFSLRRFLDRLGTNKPEIAAWLIFEEGQSCTPAEAVKLARRHLADYAPSAQFAGGTDQFFVTLNQARPSLDGLDLVSYSINPQVHAIDDLTMVENLATQQVTLSTGRTFSADRNLMVSPITLKMRFNPEEIAPEVPATDVPAQYDPRQMSLFGAGWTLGSLKYLSEGGAHSITYYETSGPMGVMGDTALQATGVYPLFHVLADVGEFADAEVMPSVSSQPLTVDGLVLRKGDSTRILLANFTASAQQVHLPVINGEVALHRLDGQTAHDAMTDPDAFRTASGERLSADSDGLWVELSPYAVVRIDLT